MLAGLGILCPWGSKRLGSDKMAGIQEKKRPSLTRFDTGGVAGRFPGPFKFGLGGRTRNPDITT